jgi:hypothetical protein
LDVNNAGTVANGTPSGTYSLAANGRGTLTLSATGGVSQLGVYVTSNPSNPLLLLQLDSGLTSSGTALAQASAVAASTVSGNYGVSFKAAIGNGEEDLADQLFSDGVSALGGNADINHFVVCPPSAPSGCSSGGTQTSNTALAGAFTAASSGRFTGSFCLAKET